jgi:hypothetical protein
MPGDRHPQIGRPPGLQVPGEVAGERGETGIPAAGARRARRHRIDRDRAASRLACHLGGELHGLGQLAPGLAIPVPAAPVAPIRHVPSGAAGPAIGVFARPGKSSIRTCLGEQPDRASQARRERPRAQ